MSSIKKVLVTGGAGYIGSHTVVKLIEEGYEPVIFDNLSNSSINVLDRIEKITGQKVSFIYGDCTKMEDLTKVFSAHKIDAIIHFAALKAVGESISHPSEYYSNNLISTLNLCTCMLNYQVKNIIFSSSATVYGDPKHLPLTEEDPVSSATNPYGTTKIFNEKILTDFQKAHSDINVALLRYFNPIGAHPSGLLGEDPNGIPNNLMPYVTQVAIGKRERLSINGNDYDTPDGTCVRDYVHVCDLAKGHVLTLNVLKKDCGLVIYNLGTGKGTSVLELVNAYQKANNIKIPYVYAPRRPGDVTANYASIEKARKELGFEPEYDIFDCCRDSHHFQTMNPDGLGPKGYQVK